MSYPMDCKQLFSKLNFNRNESSGNKNNKWLQNLTKKNTFWHFQSGQTTTNENEQTQIICYQQQISILCEENIMKFRD